MYVTEPGPIFCSAFVWGGVVVGLVIIIHGEFDPGSGRTLAACLTHASRTMTRELVPGD